MTRSRLFRIGRARTGLGLFATAEIPKGTLIVEYSGKRIPTREAQKKERTRRAKYMFEIDERWTIDGSARTNTGRYANHACKPNAEPDLVRGRMMLRAKKRIRSGDEITYDYGRDYLDLFIPRCRCASCEAR